MKKLYLFLMSAAVGIMAISSNCFAMKSPKVKFTHDEDKRLVELVSIYDKDWAKISYCMGSRSPRQCRERWMNYLCVDPVRTPFTQQEDEVIRNGIREHGQKWMQIATQLPNRSYMQVKNRGISLVRNQDTEKTRNKPNVPRERVVQPPPPVYPNVTTGSTASYFEYAPSTYVAGPVFQPSIPAYPTYVAPPMPIVPVQSQQPAYPLSTTDSVTSPFDDVDNASIARQIFRPSRPAYSVKIDSPISTTSVQPQNTSQEITSRAESRPLSIDDFEPQPLPSPEDIYWDGLSLMDSVGVDIFGDDNKKISIFSSSDDEK